MKVLKKAAPSIMVLIISILILSLLTALVMPKYSDQLVEGGMISEYYNQEIKHQVVFIGDCEVYANISPLVLYQKEGITAYVRGSSQQLIWQSYYLLEETLTYETPEIVVLNVNALRYNEPVKETYNRMTMDYMKLSTSKIKMIQASMLQEETLISYIFPILRYHSRIYELTSEDFKYLFSRKENTYLGHLVNTGVVGVDTLPTVKKLTNYQFDDICYSYLDSIRELCEKKGIELVLMKAPSLYPHWYDEYNQQVVEYADKYGLKYYNFIEIADQIGIDYKTDTYDAGLHLNESGAIKLSSYFATLLKEDFNLDSYQNNLEIKKVYDRLLERYNNEVK